MKTSHTKPSVAVANMHQIATLKGSGLSGLPDLVEILRGFVHFDGFKMTWTDERDFQKAIWHVSPDTEAADKSMTVFDSHFYNKLETKAVMSSSDLLRGAMIVDNCTRYGDGFFDSSLYADLLQPLGFRHCLRLVLRGPDRPIGFLTLARGDDCKAFSKEDERRLASVSDLLTHAMARSTMLDEAVLVPSSEAGYVVCDLGGRIKHTSERARQYLQFIFAPDCQIPDFGKSFHLEAARWLRPLINRANKADLKPPALYMHNRWGGFSARAYRMQASGGGDAMMSISITRHIPLALRLLRLASVSALPRREKEVCLLMADGLGVPDISERLSLSQHTVIGHVSSLYQRFEVNSREKLIVALLTAQ